MPYKLLGIGFFRFGRDLRGSKTALTRQVLDFALPGNNPMKEVVTGQVDPGRPDEPPCRRRDPREAAPGMVKPHERRSWRSGHGGDRACGSSATITGVTETNSALNAESLARGQVGSEACSR